MPQARSATFSGYQKKVRLGTNNDRTKSTYEATDTRTKENCNRETALKQPVEELPAAFCCIMSCDELV